MLGGSTAFGYGNSSNAATISNHLEQRLQEKGYRVDSLHGDKSQSERQTALNKFKSGYSRILIATDVVARGLDVPRISHVINYDLPFDSESYVHRIGRTGRAGREGEAILFASHREMRLLNRLERATEGQITPFDMPDAMRMLFFAYFPNEVTEGPRLPEECHKKVS